MNITLLSLISSTFLSNSPLLISNRVSILNSNFNYFFSLTFYNQKYLYIKSTIFRYGLGSIVINEQENSIDKNNIHYTEEKNIDEICKDNIFTSNYGLQYSSINIIQCSFDKIKCAGDFINIQYQSTNLNIIQCTFKSCSSKDGIIFANEANTVKIENTNCLECSCSENTIFLNKLGSVNSLSYKYNSIINSIKKEKTKQNILSNSKKQEFKNSNMSNFETIGYQLVDLHDISFEYMIVDINGPSIFIAGSPYETNFQNNEFYNSNCDNKLGCIRFSAKNLYITHIRNSFLFSASGSLISVDGHYDDEKCSLNLYNCTIQGEITGINIYTSECSTTSYFDACSTKYFTNSKYFSKSCDFSVSNDFTKSGIFSETNYFSSSASLNKIDDKVNQSNDDKKKNKGMIIGIIVGVIVVVGIIAAVVTVIIVKRKNNVIVTSDMEMIDDTSAVTVDNSLKDVMADDDPFAEEFK